MILYDGRRTLAIIYGAILNEEKKLARNRTLYWSAEEIRGGPLYGLSVIKKKVSL